MQKAMQLLIEYKAINLLEQNYDHKKYMQCNKPLIWTIYKMLDHECVSYCFKIPHAEIINLSFVLNIASIASGKIIKRDKIS
jgi:hypothetical protein